MRRALLILIVSAVLLSAGIPYMAAADSGAALYPASVIRMDGEKWGFVNVTGNFVVKPEYDFVRGFTSKGVAIAAYGKSSYEECSVAFIDKSGRTVAGPYKSYLPDFSNGVAILTSKDYGSKVFDESGKLLLQSGFTIHEYSEGLFSYSVKTSENKELYGYMNMSGNTVIAAAYSYAYAFRDGMAAVSLTDGTNAIIDKTGKTLQTSKDYFQCYGRSEGLTVFRDPATELYGYKTDDGKVAVAAKYSYAGKFSGGAAVIGIQKDYETKYGIIDNKGNLVLQPIYSDVAELGEGLFAVSKGQEYYSDEFSPKALFDSTGKQITDYVFYMVDPFNNGYASACDDTTTFFIGKDGKKAPGLPIFSGIGTASISDGVIKAEIDGGMEYLGTDGSRIWKKDEVIPLDGGFSVRILKYRPDYVTFVAYPEVQGMKDASLQKKVNLRLKSIFTDGLASDSGNGSGADGTEGADGYAADLKIGFSAEKNKDLLIIEESGYWYPIGAAHGQPSMTYHYIDLKTGAFYTLDDLFKKGSSYYARLTSLVRNQMDLNLKTNKVAENFYYFEGVTPEVTSESGFIIKNDCITIYYRPYEISAYAAGFPEFSISYGQLMDCINSVGPFWNSFNKQILGSKVNMGYDVDEKAADTILNTVKAYEPGIIDAVNTNSFAKVEKTLVKGSALYNSQKQLVASLYKKGIKEKLVKYEVYLVSYDYDKKAYRVFVFEDVSVKNPGKSYVTKRYNWCYSAVYDEKTGTAGLSNIEKWF